MLYTCYTRPTQEVPPLLSLPQPVPVFALAPFCPHKRVSSRHPNIFQHLPRQLLILIPPLGLPARMDGWMRLWMNGWMERRTHTHTSLLRFPTSPAPASDTHPAARPPCKHPTAYRIRDPYTNMAPIYDVCRTCKHPTAWPRLCPMPP